MKPILHSVSYAGLWGQHRLSLEEFVPHAAKLGYAGVMLMTKRPHLSALDYDTDKVKRLADLLGEHRLSVACLAGYNDPGVGCSATSRLAGTAVVYRAAQQYRKLHHPMGT
jgi:sugar phosphate isomerase/epimerase